jgi:hypothetical protein
LPGSGRHAQQPPGWEVVSAASAEPAWEAARLVVRAIRAWLNKRAEDQGGPDWRATANRWLDAEYRAQAALVRDVFGDPFRRLPLYLADVVDSGPVLPLAQTIYAERSFADLPVLADALEDAGCRDEDVLEHCREPGEHVRGCWVVDAILGKD